MDEAPLILIRNPASGRGRSNASYQVALEMIRASGRPFTVVTTAKKGDAKELCLAAIQEAPSAVIACGGDGTIAEIASALLGQTIPMGVLPLGTGNDFARFLDLDPSIEGATDVILNGAPRPIDVGEWACQGEHGHFVNIAGCGFDAVVAERINKRPLPLNGTAAYIEAVVHTLMSYKPSRVRITTDGSTAETTAMLCAVANANSYGGGMRIAPNAKADDGIFEVVVVQGVGRIEFLRAFPSVFKGEHLSHPKVSSFRGREVRIEADPPLPVVADGELVGRSPVSFRILDEQIWVLAPKKP